MKLNQDQLATVMENHKARLDAEVKALLDVPGIRSIIKEHSSESKGFTASTTVRVKRREPA